MTSTHERIHDVLRAYRDDVETPDIAVIHARAHRQSETRPASSRRRLVGRGALFGVLALGIGVPATAGAVVAIHHFVDDAADPLQGTNPDSKDPNASPANLPSRLTGNTEKVPGGFVQLTVQPGTVDDRSCFALVHKSDAGEVIESESACGGGGGVTYAADSLGGVTLIYSDDRGAVRAVVNGPSGRYERQLHGGYAIGPQLTAGLVTTTTYRADGSTIAVHHGESTKEPDGSLTYADLDHDGS